MGILIKESQLKKNKVAFFAFLIMMFAVLAVARAEGAIKFGLKGGVNFANMSGRDIDPGWKGTTRFAAGGFFALKINKLLAIQPEFFYSLKGGRWDSIFYGDQISVKANFAYLDIPFLVKIYIPMSAQSKLQPNFFLGPYAGIRMSAKIRVTTPDGSQEDDMEDPKSLDFGLTAGAGIDFSLGKGKLIFDVRYSLGLSTISKIEEIKNNVFALMAGYSFN